LCWEMSEPGLQMAALLYAVLVPSHNEHRVMRLLLRRETSGYSLCLIRADLRHIVRDQPLTLLAVASTY
jgi:hypothetical protein